MNVKDQGHIPCFRGRTKTSLNIREKASFIFIIHACIHNTNNMWAKKNKTLISAKCNYVCSMLKPLSQLKGAIVIFSRVVIDV